MFSNLIYSRSWPHSILQSLLDWQPQSGSLLYVARQTAQQKKYLGTFRRWKTWAQQHSLQAFPVKESHLVLYWQNQVHSSKSAIEEAYNAISWVHAMASCDSPTESQFVRTVMQGLQSNLAKPVTKKLPVTTEMLGAIVDDAEKSGSLAD